MEWVDCNCCGSDNYRIVYTAPDVHFYPDEFFTVVECLDCGLGYLNPRPTRAEMGRFYPRDFYERFVEDEEYHQRRYWREARYLADLTQNGREKRLLDLGCANGGFPRLMRQLGWQVEGVEVSDNALQIDDFPVYRCEFDQIPVDEPRYDAVTAWAVLEHVHDPKAYFRKAAEVLKSGGRFVFLVTNFKSISSRYLFREDLPRHLYFFTEETVRRYLEENGLYLARVDYSDKIYSMIPENWLRFYVYKYLLRRPMRWEDTAEPRLEYLARHGWPNNFRFNLLYALTHPFTVVERRLARLVGKWQIWRRTYGVVTYVAEKP